MNAFLFKIKYFLHSKAALRTEYIKGGTDTESTGWEKWDTEWSWMWKNSTCIIPAVCSEMFHLVCDLFWVE